MEHGEAGPLSRRRDDQVDDVGTAMLATIREQALDVDCAIEHLPVDRSLAKAQFEVSPSCAVLSSRSNAEEHLEINRLQVASDPFMISGSTTAATAPLPIRAMTLLSTRWVATGSSAALAGHAS